jgi:hypothetical protein
METLELKKGTAIKLFKSKTLKDMQNILMDNFGNELFLTKITERVTSYEDAYDLADSRTRQECEIFQTDTQDIVAYKKLKLIIRVINEEWIPDFTNMNQQKWYPWFKVLSSGSGFGFSFSGYGYGRSCAHVGSRLCFENKEKCNYVAEHFIELYNQFLLTK